jgi:hypothetical protein
MREKRLTRRAGAALSNYAGIGCNFELLPDASMISVAPSGRRLVCRDDYERTQPVTEWMRELLAARPPLEGSSRPSQVDP